VSRSLRHRSRRIRLIAFTVAVLLPLAGATVVAAPA